MLIINNPVNNLLRKHKQIVKLRCHYLFENQDQRMPYLYWTGIIIRKLFLMKLIPGKDKSRQSTRALLKKEVIFYYSMKIQIVNEI